MPVVKRTCFLLIHDMEKVFNISKQMILGLASARLWNNVQALFASMHARLKWYARPRTWEPNYHARGDHLFIPEQYSIKQAFLAPTVLGVYILIVGAAFLLTAAAQLLSVSILLVASGIIALFYFTYMFFKLSVIATSLKSPFMSAAGDISQLHHASLPVYTILVPLRDEAAVMRQIIDALTRIDYPQEKLDLIVTVERFDHDTKDAMSRCGVPSHWRILELPDTAPKTKPKALNCAFLHARGEYLVIYDAEIIPDPDQLKKAVTAFNARPEIAVFQPRLDHYNTYQNLLTRLFTIEFTFHYDMFLPSLAHFGLPVPLSGHSTHFRTDALRRAGAWDPYNVAEDCEIGLRLFRMGYRSGIFDSISREEAASTVTQWIKQRTRWMKGFIQTSIVHLRYPLHAKREMGGWRNFIVFLLVVPGTVLINILNIFMGALLALWLIFQPAFIQTLYPLPVLYIANVAAIIGGSLFIYLNMIALYRREKFDLVRWWFCIPLYWILLAYATTRAAFQLVLAPQVHVWEKTTHGSHLSKPTHYET